MFQGETCSSSRGDPFNQRGELNTRSGPIRFGDDVLIKALFKM